MSIRIRQRMSGDRRRGDLGNLVRTRAVFPQSPVYVSADVANLRAFDAGSGALLWEVLNFIPIGKTPNGSVYGYRWTRATKDFGYVGLAFVPMFFGAAVLDDNSKLQRKSEPSFANRPSTDLYVADCYEVDIEGNETLVLSDVARAAGPANYANMSGPSSIDHTGTFTSGIVFQQSQLYQINDDGLILSGTTGSGSGQVAIEVTDLHKHVTSHSIRLYPRALYPQAGGTPAWVFRSGGVNAKFGLYATAEKIQEALATLPTVASVAVTGGPACQARVDIDITFNAATGGITHCAIEYAYTYPSSPNTAQIWDLNTHAPVVAYATVSMGTADTFTSDGSGVLGSGNWGTAGKRAWSKLTWTMPEDEETVPYWGTVDARAWTVTAFDGMTQTQERRWVLSGGFGGIGGYILDSVPITRGITAVRDGKVAITSTSCRVPTLDGTIPYQTHVILDEGSGASIDSGWSGLMSSSTVLFGDAGNQYRYGTRARYVSATNSTAGQNLDVGPYAEPAYVESFGADPDANDLRERDVVESFGGFGVGSNLVFLEPLQQQTFFPPSSVAEYRSPLLGTLSQRVTKRDTWLAWTTRQSAEQIEYPFGTFQADMFSVLSAFGRFNESAEWRLVHGTETSGAFSPGIATDWFPADVSLATVDAALLDWYGSVSFGGPQIASRNFPAPDPWLEGRTPPIPTWQKLGNIRILRDAGSTPNPLSPLAPQNRNCLVLQLRNLTTLRTHALCGLSPATGVIQWQRDIGRRIAPIGDVVNAGGYAYAFAQNRIVVFTACRPTVDLPVYPRGAE